MIKNATYWIFDRILFRPIKVKFLGFNEETDGWMRFKYLETTSESGEFTAYPPSDINVTVFRSRPACLRATMDKLMDLLHTN